MIREEDLVFLDKISRNYDIDVEIKVQEGDVPDRTHRTLRTLVGLDMHLSDPHTIVDYTKAGTHLNLPHLITILFFYHCMTIIVIIIHF